MTACRTPSGKTKGTEFNALADTPHDPEDIEVMFHPYEPTFTAIGNLIRDPNYKRIDIAMYSMEADPEKSAIIQAIIEQKHRIPHDLKIRLIYQGYDETRLQKSVEFEKLGIDVRWTGAKDVHHKFGVFYGDEHNAIVSGSGNWSSRSNHNYSENMLFLKQHPGLTQKFLKEFELIWTSTKEFDLMDHKDTFDLEGYDSVEPMPHPDLGEPIEMWQGINAHFNSDNYKSVNGIFPDGKVRNKSPAVSTLTDKVISYIDKAKRTIHIATPRISSRPIFDAIGRAIDRDVQVKIVSSEKEFNHAYVRPTANIGKLWSCDLSAMQTKEDLKRPDGKCCDRLRSGEFIENTYNKACSVSQNHVKFFDELYAQDANSRHDVRLKLFTTNPSSKSIAKQMHAKFIIIDETHALAGSFNFSYNSEFSFFENMIEIDGRKYPNTVKSLMTGWKQIYEMGREGLFAQGALMDQLKTAEKLKKKIDCPAEARMLTYAEIQNFLRLAKKWCKN